MAQHKCDVCDGKKKIKCEDCDGTGRWLTNKKITCGQCGGGGQKLCWKCNGSGIVYD